MISVIKELELKPKLWQKKRRVEKKPRNEFTSKRTIPLFHIYWEHVTIPTCNIWHVLYRCCFLSQRQRSNSEFSLFFTMSLAYRPLRLDAYGGIIYLSNSPLEVYSLFTACHHGRTNELPPSQRYTIPKAVHPASVLPEAFSAFIGSA